MWVMCGGLEVGQSLPVYPNKLTISEQNRTSREGQSRSDGVGVFAANGRRLSVNL